MSHRSERASQIDLSSLRLLVGWMLTASPLTRVVWLGPESRAIPFIMPTVTGASPLHDSTRHPLPQEGASR
jgi:hypothetical protein